MRRKDREVTDFAEIMAILEKCEIVRLAMVDEGIPYIVPLNFGYGVETTEENQANGEKKETVTLYFHSAAEGRKIDILKKNPYVCFEGDCSVKLTKGQDACSWSTEFESVIGYGRVSFLTEVADKKKALDIMMGRYGFEGTPVYPEELLERMSLYQLTVESISGKRKR